MNLRRNKLKKKQLILMIISLLFIGSILFFVIKNIKEEQKINQESINQIKKTYQLFEENLSTYNQNRETLSNYLTNYYQDNLEMEYSKYITLLKNQEDTIQKLEQNTQVIKKNCQDRIFKEKKINTICSSYEEYYETVVNIYINDYRQINTLIQSYNEEESIPLEEYTPTIVNDYIDYNQDGKYLEQKEEE